MRSPSPRCRGNVVRLFRYRPGQDPDAGAVADVTSLIAADVECSVQPADVATEVAAKRLRQTTVYEVLLYENYGLKPKDLIEWADDQGVTHNLFVIGQLDQAGQAVCQLVKAVEVL